MKINQFLLLSDPEKEEIIWEEGIFLATYNEGNLMYDAYKLFDFYALFSYDVNNTEKLTITAHHHQDALPIKVL